MHLTFFKTSPFLRNLFSLIRIPTFCLVCALLLKECLYQSGHQFSLRDIRTSWEFTPFPLHPLPTDQKPYVKEILKQPFSYLGQGKQCWVFESQDHLYVLKFFKQKHLHPKRQWFSFFPLSISAQKKNNRRRESLLHTLESCTLAWNRLSHATALLYLQLNQETALTETITLLDPLGLSYSICSKDYKFILQKKVIPLEELLKDSTKSREEIAFVLTKVEEAIKQRSLHHIRDRDSQVVQNMGWNPQLQEALFLDFGFFYLEKEELDPQQEIESRRRELHEWMSRNSCCYGP